MLITGLFLNKQWFIYLIINQLASILTETNISNIIKIEKLAKEFTSVIISILFTTLASLYICFVHLNFQFHLLNWIIFVPNYVVFNYSIMSLACYVGVFLRHVLFFHSTASKQHNWILIWLDKNFFETFSGKNPDGKTDIT